MSTSALQDPLTKTPVFLSEQNQETPIGFLFLEGDSLVIEFPGKHPEIRIPQPKARKTVEFIGDSSIRIELPDNSEKKIRLYLSSNGEGRFAVYGIREWTGIDGTEPRAVRKRAFLMRFDSTGAKIVTFWQLVLPYVIFGVTFLLQAFANETSPEVDYFAAAWQKLALSPIVAVHYAFLLIPAVAILFYNRMWALLTTFQMSLLLVLITAGCYFLPQEWQFLPTSESPLLIQEYWLVFTPYMVLLLLPAFYYIVVMRRL